MTLTTEDIQECQKYPFDPLESNGDGQFILTSDGKFSAN
jgi:hypothetical protein